MRFTFDSCDGLCAGPEAEGSCVLCVVCQVRAGGGNRLAWSSAEEGAGGGGGGDVGMISRETPGAGSLVGGCGVRRLIGGVLRQKGVM